LGSQRELFTERLKNMELSHRNNRNIGRPFVGRHAIVILIVLMAFVSGCKVKYSFSGASISPLAKTFSIQYFQNRAPIVQPGLSQNITDALIDKCKAQTSLKYTNSVGDMDFVGEITDYNTKPLTVGADAQAATNRFTISVKVKFTNAIDPTLSFDQTFTRYEDYNSNLDLSSVEADLSSKIIDMIVEDIFNQAFVNW
jgi:Lipopolysaccharide-assembly